MTIELYGLELSPPCRTVLLAANHLGVELKLVPCDVRKGEQKTPEFAKINTAMTIPAIKDGDFCLGESRAIICYLANAYGKGNSLYPADLRTRSKIDTMIYFDFSLFQNFADYMFPSVFGNEPLSDTKKEKLEETIHQFETILGRNKFAAGSEITISDHTLIVSIMTIKSLGTVNFSTYPKVEAWITECQKTIPKYEEISGQYVNTLANFFKEKLKEKGQI